MATDPGIRKAACTKYEALLEDYLGGALEGPESNNAAEHWKNCAGCRQALEDAASSVRLLRLAEPSADPEPGFSRKVMARIRAAERERTGERTVFWQPFVSLAWRFAATATLALGVMVTYNAGWGHRPQPSVGARRPMQTADIFAPDPANPPANGDEVLMMVAESGHGK
jgi:anti-sigma-K factor RskA